MCLDNRSTAPQTRTTRKWNHRRDPEKRCQTLNRPVFQQPARSDGTSNRSVADSLKQQRVRQHGIPMARMQGGSCTSLLPQAVTHTHDRTCPDSSIETSPSLLACTAIAECSLHYTRHRPAGGNKHAIDHLRRVRRWQAFDSLDRRPRTASQRVCRSRGSRGPVLLPPSGAGMSNP